MSLKINVSYSEKDVAKSRGKGHPIEVLSPYRDFEVLEGDQIQGVVVAKFPDMESARKWYFGKPYQEAAKRGQYIMEFLWKELYRLKVTKIRNHGITKSINKFSGSTSELQ